MAKERHVPVGPPYVNAVQAVGEEGKAHDHHEGYDGTKWKAE